jgi:hypothetical protein
MLALMNADAALIITNDALTIKSEFRHVHVVTSTDCQGLP